MLSSLRLRILIITLMVITLALTINASVSYLTLQTHNDQQVTQQLASIAQGNALAIEEWVDARVAILEAARTPVIDNDPLAPLVQLAESGGFLTAFFGQSDGRHLSSDGWVPGSDLIHASANGTKQQQSRIVRSSRCLTWTLIAISLWLALLRQSSVMAVCMG